VRGGHTGGIWEGPLSGFQLFYVAPTQESSPALLCPRAGAAVNLRRRGVAQRFQAWIGVDHRFQAWLRVSGRGSEFNRGSGRFEGAWGSLPANPRKTEEKQAKKEVVATAHPPRPCRLLGLAPAEKGNHLPHSGPVNSLENGRTSPPPSFSFCRLRASEGGPRSRQEEEGEEGEEGESRCHRLCQASHPQPPLCLQA